MTDVVSSALVRPGARLAAGFCLDAASLITQVFDQDLIPCVVVLGVLQANVAADARAAAGPGEAPTPFTALNRAPVSVYRLARNLSLPYETARRHAARMVATGVCVRDGAGLAVAPETLFRAPARNIAEEIWRTAVALRSDLVTLGLRVTPYDPNVDDDEKRRVARLANTFFLAALRITVEATGTDLISALTFLAVHRANRGEMATATTSLAGRPDVDRTPVSVYRLARQLRLPYETTRRHAVILVNEGLCQRLEGGGLIVPGEVLKSAPISAAMTEVWALLATFITAAFGPMETVKA